MKKLLMTSLTIPILLLAFIQTSMASSKIQVFINGAPKKFDQSPVIENGRTLVPMRAIFESLGGVVFWDDQNKKAYITKGSSCIEVQLGSKQATISTYDKEGDACINPRYVTLDQAPKLINGRVMVPLRFASENLGSTVLWDSKNKTIKISTNNNQAAPIKVPKYNGFVEMNSDGFIIQIPKDWHTVNSELKYPLASTFNQSLSASYSPESEVYTLNYKTDVAYNTEIRIIPYNRSVGYDAFVESKTYPFEEYKKISVSNADAAYERISYLDSVTGLSIRERIVIKGDVCYILTASHNISSAEGSWIDYRRKEILKYRDDVNKMFSSFQITSPPVNFKSIVQSNTPVEIFDNLKLYGN